VVWRKRVWWPWRRKELLAVGEEQKEKEEVEVMQAMGVKMGIARRTPKRFIPRVLQHVLDDLEEGLRCHAEACRLFVLE